jgi:hypothetical protein
LCIDSNSHAGAWKKVDSIDDGKLMSCEAEKIDIYHLIENRKLTRHIAPV